MKNPTDIKARIKSVAETRKITSAMETISIAKMRKAMTRFESNRAYFATLRDVIRDVAAHTNAEDSRYLRPAHGKNTLIAVIASDKGLAGGFNHNVLKLAYERITAAEHATVACVGMVAGEFFRIHGIPVEMDFAFGSSDPIVEDAREITDKIVELYDRGVVDEAYLVYTRMENSANMFPEALKLLPLPADEFDSEEELYTELEYEPSAEEVFNALIPQYLTGTVYGALIQSSAAEHCSRRAAMNNATKNAGDLLEELNTDFHRARQEAVTNEISEIITAAMGVGNEKR